MGRRPTLANRTHDLVQVSVRVVHNQQETHIATPMIENACSTRFTSNAVVVSIPAFSRLARKDQRKLSAVHRSHSQRNRQRVDLAAVPILRHPNAHLYLGSAKVGAPEHVEPRPSSMLCTVKGVGVPHVLDKAVDLAFLVQV